MCYYRESIVNLIESGVILMGISASWYDESKSLIILRFEENWGWNDFDMTKAAVQSLLEFHNASAQRPHQAGEAVAKQQQNDEGNDEQL